jgi:acyl-coenzyme A thioesterase PaaI-like protein
VFAQAGITVASADATFAAASDSDGILAVALNMETGYLLTVVSGTACTERAAEVHLGRRTAQCHLAVGTEDGDLVVPCQGVLSRKRESMRQEQLDWRDVFPYCSARRILLC